MQGIFITGTSTGVGKTILASVFIKYFAKSHTVKVRKPVETNCIEKAGVLIAKDAHILRHCAHDNEALSHICAYRFKACASAERASMLAGKTLTLTALVVACKNFTTEKDFVIVEGAGGLYSPIAKNALNADLAKALDMPIVIVVKSELGCINHALLTIEVAHTRALNIFCVVLNEIKKDSLAHANSIEKYGKIPVLSYHKAHEHLFMAKLRKLTI